MNKVSDFTFTLNADGKSYTITEYNNASDLTVVIPKFHTDGKTIVAIGDYSFQGMGLTSVALHDSINVIGLYAFEGNELLNLYLEDYSVTRVNSMGIILASSEVGFSNGGLEIKDYAFANNKLTDLKLSNGLTKIGDSAFENNELDTVIFPETTKLLGSKAFFGNNIQSITIPASVTTLGDYTFKNNGLSSVIFEGELPSVLGADIFGANDGLGLRTVEVPAEQINNYKSVADLLGVFSYAIYNSELPYDPLAYDGTWYDSSLKIRESDISPVSDFTFTYNSTNKAYTITGFTNVTDKTVVIPKFHTDGKPITEIGASVFANKGLTSAVIPNSVTTIRSYAFQGNQLKTVSIPKSVTVLGLRTFGSNLLETVFLYGAPAVSTGETQHNTATDDRFINNPTLLKGSIFVSAEYLTSYRNNNLYVESVDRFSTNPTDKDVVNGLAYAYNSTLGGWEVIEYVDKTLKNITIPSARADGTPIVSISANVFQNSLLTSLELSQGLKNIGDSSFNNNNLTQLVIPNGVTTIGTSAFTNNKLVSVTIPDTVTTIRSYAFQGNQLKTVSIPKNVTILGHRAFGSNLLETVYLFGGPAGHGESGSNTNTDVKFINNPTLLKGSIFVPASYLVSYQSHNLYIENIDRFTTNPNDENIVNGLAYAYNTTLGGWEVVEYIDKTMKDIIIPAKRADDKPVVSIGYNVFNGVELNSISLPEGLKNIGQYAFKNTTLKNINLPSTLTNMGYHAFAYSQLTSVKFNGPKPTASDAFIYSSGLLNGSVLVPSAYLSAYQGSYSSSFGFTTNLRFAGY